MSSSVIPTVRLRTFAVEQMPGQYPPYARLVADTLGVPVALVSLVEADRQVFPAQVGLARGSAAIRELGMIAYAGMPLTDSEGHVLGSLCAIDTPPRAWSSEELARLADLAAACCAELRLRIASRYAAHALDAAERSQAATRQYAAQARLALDRSELMLRAAEDLADTAGLADVRRRVRNLVTGNLKPSYVGLVLLDGWQLRWVPDSDLTIPRTSAVRSLGWKTPAPVHVQPARAGWSLSPAALPSEPGENSMVVPAPARPAWRRLCASRFWGLPAC